ncbi:MAG: BTAD domain-containing putative transcriptional regulator [Anaerolineae bacterium]
MAYLSLSLLGPFQVTLDGQPVTGFKSNKERALLAYLAVEADRPHRREMLAGLLWPEWPDRDALSNLRYALSNLRRVIGDRGPTEVRAQARVHDAEPPVLLITRATLQFNTASDHSLDVAAFTDMAARGRSASEADLAGLEEAVASYRGSFLEGFSVGDSPAFEEWALLTREQIARQMSSALHRLAAAYEQRGQYEQAQSYAWRQVELEPWDETAHQQLMRVLALSDQRGAALAQYETCRRLLAEELDVEPAAETTRLYDRIRTGKLRAPAPAPASPPDLAASLPPFLEGAAPPVETPTFVARERELAQLDRFLDLALAGQGRVGFVTGDAGSGKTALVQAFSRRAQEVHADLIVASGNCNAHTGIGDPYLPFREILERLTGDVEARWAAGAMTREHAQRLWNTLPLAAQALLETGPDLLDTFVPRAALLGRAATYAPGRPDWLRRLDELVGRRPTSDPSAPGPQQRDLFEQYTRLLQALARQVPLVLVLDDLQWADAGSIHLLFHLGRHLAGSRILILGAYRPEEVASGRDGTRHPLEPVLNEFQRGFGNIIVDLGQTGRRNFVEAYLDSEPNRLGVAFREMLYRQTHGHPLFTVELLQSLQERGELVQDPEGCWVEGLALDWETLPARVEAAIAERIGRLAEPLQAALRVASVEGEDFTAEVIARVLGIDERDMVPRLSSELDRRHRLVRAQAIERLGSQRVSRYRFRNYLFQKYLYDNLDQVERVYLHEDVGNALEELFAGQANESAGLAAAAPVAVQLAWHFQEAGITDKAIRYLHQAGERAVQLSAYREGLAHLTKGLALLTALPESAERDQQELALQLALGMAWVGIKAYGPETEAAYTRARELGEQMGETSQICLALGRLSIAHYTRAEHQRARELAEEALSLAQRTQDPLHVALGHRYLGSILLCLGEYTTARAHLEQMISFYDPQQHHRTLVSLRASDAGTSALAYHACCLWYLGYPDQAWKQGQEAIALARELGHPFSLADVLWSAGCMVSQMRRDVQALKDHADELMRLAREKVPVWSVAGICFQGEALVMLGQVQEGMARIREGIAAYQSAGIDFYLPQRLGFLAEGQWKAGQFEEGLATLAEALAVVEETDERHWEAELHRLKGELLLAQGDEAQAEASLLQAIEVARRQSARSWELRATTNLARLWQRQGKRDEARQILAEIYGWFTEGFDTPDLQEAQALLEELSHNG